VVRQLQPWFANISKRQVKSPKVYLRDSGILHRLLGIDDHDALDSHPKVGASLEGFVVEQIATIVQPAPMYFWRTQQGAELDVYVEIAGRRVGIEVKRTSAPKLTPSIRHAMADLELHHLIVAYPGSERFALARHVTAMPISELLGVRDARQFARRVDR
jgi:predicted AAA+ superfamily ATPase